MIFIFVEKVLTLKKRVRKLGRKRLLKTECIISKVQNFGNDQILQPLSYLLDISQQLITTGSFFG